MVLGAQARARAKAKVLEVGPFTHMVYNADVLRNERGAVYYAQQMVAVDPKNGGPYARRASDWGGIAGVNATTVQWIGVFKKRGGFINVEIIDGQIWTTTITSGWGLAITTAQLAAAGITLSATALVYAVTFNNQLVVNDGVNQPFVWNGTGGGGLTKLTNAPTKCFGAPTIYYAKLFFIKDVAANGTDRSTLVWSEENQPNTGYEAGGFLNAWTLEQAGAGPLVDLFGTNEALYYWRPQAIGMIRGAVTPDFSSAGTHDDVSREVGTTTAGGVAMGESELWFVDAKGWPWMLPVGGKPVCLVNDIADYFLPADEVSTLTLSAADIARIQIVAIPFDRAVLFSYQRNNNGYSFEFFAFSTVTRRAMSFWDFNINVRRIGEAWDDESSIAGLWVAAPGVPGKTLLHPPRGTVPRYATSGVDQSILNPALMLRPMGAQASGVEWQFTECAVEFDVGADTGLPAAGAVELRANTDEYLQTGSGGVNTLVGTVSLQNLGQRQSQRRVWGLNRRLRFLAPRLEQISYNLRGWAISRVAVTAIPLPASVFRT